MPDQASAGDDPAARGVLHRLLWAGLVLVLLVVIAAGARQLLGPRRSALPVLGELPAFLLVERSGRPVAAADLGGAPWVADFIFTRCNGICPVLTARMAELGGRLAGRGLAAVRLVSFTVDPEHDTPEVLREYARGHGASEDWLFLTGERAALYRLVGEGFRLSVAQAPPGAELPPGELVTHSDRFVLVDGRLRIRGYYHGGDRDELDRLVSDAEQLFEERP